MTHTIQNDMSVQQNTITLPTAGTYAEKDIVITNKVNPGSFTNAPVNGQTYTEDTTANTVIPAEGYLYINKGWHDNTKISLGHLIPEIASNDAGEDEMRYGYKAYNENGQVITGTMVDVTPTFTGGSVTATASGAVATTPKVTINAAITGAASSTFGMTTTAITGTEGTDYIKIDATGTPTDGAVTAKANASRTAVQYETANVGYINVAANTTASAAASAQQNTATITVEPEVTNSFAARYIPVVKSQTFVGGTLSAGTPSITGSNPTFTTSISASNSASTYGLTSTAPTSGTEGTNYIKFTPTGTPGDAQTKTVSIPVTREAVTFSNIAGVIAAKTNATAIAEGNANATASVTVTATAGTATPKYMPIVSVGGAGGGITGSASAQIATYPKVTVSSVASDNASTYGFTNTEPSGTYVSIIGNTNIDSGVVRPSATATRAAVTYTNTAGAIAAHNETQLLASGNKTLTGTDVTVKPEVVDTNFKDYYVPVATIKAVPSAPTISKPSASASVSVADNAGATVSGVLTSAPSTGDYIKITPDLATTDGTAKSNASAATNGAGVVSASTTGETVTGSASTVSITNKTTSDAARYIKIYDGSYTIS